MTKGVAAPYRFDDAPAMAGTYGAAAGPCAALAAPIGSVGEEQDLADLAVHRLRSLGVDFGDLRLGRDHERGVMVMDDNLSSHNQTASSGIGVRALVKGFWGFAASSDLTPDG